MLNRLVRSLLVASGAFGLGFGCPGSSDAHSPHSVTVHSPPPCYVLGDAMLVRFDFRFTNPANTQPHFTQFDYMGLPGSLVIRLLDSRGGEVPKVVFPGGPGPGPGRPDAKEVFRLFVGKGEDLQMTCPLATYYKVTEPGWYDVEFLAAQPPAIARQRVLVVRPPTDRGIAVKRYCYSPAAVPSSVSCTVRAGQSVGVDGKTYWLAVVSDIEAKNGIISSEPIRSLHIPAPKGVRVETADLDINWRLWSVLEAEGKHALVIWDLRSGDVKTAIPWCDDKIELGATLISTMSAGMFVAAGRKGGPRLTTLSIP